MLKNPATKYNSFAAINLAERAWPSKTITHAPIWLSTDLRDGNQALIEPMNVQQKLELFRLLVDIGFKEIEVGFPSASQAEFDFIRQLIADNLVPDDVKIQVLTPAKEHLIYRTFEALRGAKNAIVHLYNATSPIFRRIVFSLDCQQTINLAVTGAKLLKELAAKQPETNWQFQYSPETFTATELEFAKDICNAVLEIWQPTPDNKAIINLPASVEVATPNIFADQVEWMHRNLRYRDSIILCVHPHNDRGCAIAAAELAQMAGAQRVEGCLFGNGERTGNVDLVTLALNLYTQGINPGLDFSNINKVAQIIENCTQLPIHPRHPYVGELVFTAFSGSHQDAIKKGFAVKKDNELWQISYLPLDPKDVGRTYESIVRVNSQSGKGGIAFLLERDYNIVLPRKLQIEFSQVVQNIMDSNEKEMSSADLWKLLEQEYLQANHPIEYVSHQILQTEKIKNAQRIWATLEIDGKNIGICGYGNGPIDAFVNALSLDIKIQHYEEHSRNFGSNADAIAYVEVAGNYIKGSLHGIGVDANIVTASFKAILSAVNRTLKNMSAQNLRDTLKKLEGTEAVFID